MMMITMMVIDEMILDDEHNHDGLEEHQLSLHPNPRYGHAPLGGHAPPAALSADVALRTAIVSYVVPSPAAPYSVTSNTPHAAFTGATINAAVIKAAKTPKDVSLVT